VRINTFQIRHISGEKTLGQVLKGQRFTLGLPQRQLALKLGVSPAMSLTLRTITGGHRWPF
jgi:hypothetical protein